MKGERYESFKTMDKKNIAEIRRQFSMNNCTATKICGCYVDHEKNKKFESKSSFLMLPEEEEFKYFDIFKHTLSGSLGRNLINFELIMSLTNIELVPHRVLL